LILLVLFDVDGTLFLTHDPLAGEAMSETLEERFDVALQPDAADRVDHLGETTLRIARLVLRERPASRRPRSTAGSPPGVLASPSVMASCSRRRTRATG
jgi:beta-phosphoglucomutase-like phosphatase (HAD superfamily)